MINIPLKPMFCNYFLTYKCGSTCEFCDFWRVPGFKNVKDKDNFDDIEKNLLDLKDLGVQYIDFTGGDPLLRDDLPKILSLAKNLGFITMITSDGRLYNKMSFEIADMVDYLHFSVDSNEAIEHNRIRGVDSFDAAIAGIKQAKKLKQDPIINYTVTRENIAALPDMVTMAQKLGVKLYINPVYNHFGLEGFDDMSIRYLKRYFNHKNVLVNLAVMAFVKAKGNRAGLKARCRAAQSVITITPDNCIVSPCVFHQKEKIKIEKNLKMLYNSPNVLRAKRYQGVSEKCEGCMCWPYIVPSFNYKADNYFALNLLSFGMFWMKSYKGVDVK